MAEESGRTLVCSVLFVDIVGYSKTSVGEQFDLKQRFNSMLGAALDVLQRRDRVIVDTGDGAAVVFLGDPEDALVVGLAMRAHAVGLPMRMGINLGPVKLMSDLNDQVNVVGDGINAAQRVMSFADPGELLVSGNYRDVVTRLSSHYAQLFTARGKRTDKHVREHEVFAVSDELRIEDPGALPTVPPVASRPATSTPAEPASIHDAGAHLMISGTTRASVGAALERFRQEGATVLSPVTRMGDQSWVASCTRPGSSGDVQVEVVGLTRVITGTDEGSVSDKAAELVGFGARLVTPAELVDGVWTAVCDVSG